MTTLTVGCIGCGNMGGAILRGLAARPEPRLVGFDHTRAKVEALSPADRPGRVEWAENPQALAAAADVILLAVKPHQIAPMLEAIRPQLGPDKVVVSVAAAVTMSNLALAVEGRCPVVRVMPNLPALVGRGVFALCLEDAALTPQKKTLLQDLFGRLGLAVVLPEAQFAAFSAVVGCGPAFVCLFMEGLQNAAVTAGLRADLARDLVAAMVEGTARLALEGAAGRSEDFAGIRGRVCSPGGTTICGVNHLERHGVRGHVTDAVLESLRRDRELATD